MRRSSLTPAYTYSETAGRYRGASGRFVSAAKVRAALDTALDRAEQAVAANTEALRAGTIDLATWQTQMAREVKNVHLASAALAKGGWAQMSPADLGRAGQRIRTQYEYLRNFAAQIASGEQRLDGTLGRRAGLYVQAGRTTYHAQEREERRKRGATEERNVLHASDSCAGCLDADALGWVALGTLPLPGTRLCKTNCRCSVETR